MKRRDGVDEEKKEERRYENHDAWKIFSPKVLVLPFHRLHLFPVFFYSTRLNTHTCPCASINR